MYIAMLFLALAAVSCNGGKDRIDREALVTRNNPHVTELNPLHSLTLGNGEFAFTADATGLQTFPEFYKDGLSLGTYSEWAWHTSENPMGYSHNETLEDHELPGHPHGIYSVQVGHNQSQRSQDASNWVRGNPQRLHLGNMGFAGMKPEEITDVDQTLDMWNGVLTSNFNWNGSPVTVETVSSGDMDMIAARVKAEKPVPVKFRFPYPTGEHTDDASNWDADDKHSTEVVGKTKGYALVKRTVDDALYYVNICWKGNAELEQTGPNELTLTPSGTSWSFSEQFCRSLEEVGEMSPAIAAKSFSQAAASGKKMWNEYWKTSGVVDFSHCTNEAAPMLEKRVVLSQYLIRVQEAQNFPPAETGLTYNSWYGKYHMEMVMWHSFHYATWNKPELLEKQLKWYKSVMPVAKGIAGRQGFNGVRWMKMTDPSGLEAPSDIGSYLIWQQPHPIYMAELIYRAKPSKAFLDEYYDLVQQSAEFLADFVNYDEENDRYVIEGACGANESYNEKETFNPSFELSYLHFGLKVAQLWRERKGEPRNAEWDEIMNKLSMLAASPEGIYLAAERGPGIPDFKNGTAEITVSESFSTPAGGYLNAQRPKTVKKTVKISDYPLDPANPRWRNPFYVSGSTSENLLAYGMLPECRLFTLENMRKTMDRASENWRASNNWSWNSPTFAMNATRVGRSDMAVKVITMDGHTENVLPSGNNYRSTTLRMYLPGNGGLLLAVGLMCAGWDGCEEKNPGFPKDGTWDVRWEGLTPMP